MLAVRIWDVAGTDQTLKAEYKVLAGKLKDLAWDGESKRIVAVGDGRQKCVLLSCFCVKKKCCG